MTALALISARLSFSSDRGCVCGPGSRMPAPCPILSSRSALSRCIISRRSKIRPHCAGRCLSCAKGRIKGILLLAREGINGTIAGTDEGMERVMAHIRALPGCADLESKDSRAPELPFRRMKVRLKKEIVTMGEPDIDPRQGVGRYVAPEDWNALISDPDTILIDTRNDYEVAIGTFKGAEDPKTKSFREFPEWFRRRRQELEAKGRLPKIAMFCTGGIRCEKSTSFARAEGVDEVYHLKGGILKYLETVPEEEPVGRRVLRV